jgi:hypothetical protein
MTTRWRAGKDAEFKARALAERPNLKAAAETAAHRAVELLRRFNPVQLIGHMEGAGDRIEGRAVP